eukprot:m.225474 g.225474  ORF g.225474 m.225474 type:complete len:1105 (+) comp33461_c1_seq2:999-4313(+)
MTDLYSLDATNANAITLTVERALEDVSMAIPTSSRLQKQSSSSSTFDVKIPRGRQGWGLSIESGVLGHRVVKIMGKAANDQLNVQMGDIIVSVDGQQTANLAHSQVIRLFQLAKESSRAMLNLQLKRSAFVAAPNANAINVLKTGEATNDINVLCCTCNIGNREPSSFSDWIPQNGLMPGSEEQYDVIAIGMQESHYKLAKQAGDIDSDSSDDEDAANTNSPTKKKKKLIHDHKTSNRCTHHLQGMIRKVLGDNYHQVEVTRRMEMRLFVYVNETHVSAVSAVESTAENTGIAHVMANKGGLCIKFELYGTALCFVSCHLAAHEGQKFLNVRNSNVREILEGCRIGNTKFDITAQFPFAFWMGDLNYRVNVKALPQHAFEFGDGWKCKQRLCEKEWAQTDAQSPESRQRWLKADPKHRAEWEIVKSLVDELDNKDQFTRTKALNTLLEADELISCMTKKEIFVGWHACVPNFKPTFKVLRAPDPRVSPANPLGYLEQRVPSYTDRILWKALPGCADRIKAEAFEACPNFMTSDHKPVRASFKIDIGSREYFDRFQTGRLGRGDLELTLTNFQATLKRTGFSLDTPDAYLDFHSWPPGLLTSRSEGQRRRSKHIRTETKWNTYTPNWKKEIVRATINSDTVNSCPTAHLLIAVMDQDRMSKDDCLGQASISLAAIQEHLLNSTEPFDVHLALTLRGVEIGMLTGSIEVGKIRQHEAERQSFMTSTAKSYDDMTISGRTGKNASINGVYMRADFTSDASPLSPVYFKVEGAYWLHYYLKQWRIVRQRSSIGSAKCVATMESADPLDPASPSGKNWKVHVSGARAMDNQQKVWAYDRAVSVVRGKPPPTFEMCGNDKEAAQMTGIYKVTNSEQTGSWSFARQGGKAQTLLQWDASFGAWNILVDGVLTAYYETDRADTPPRTPGWQVVVGYDDHEVEILKANKSLVLTVPDVLPQSPTDDLSRSPSKRKKPKRRGTMDVADEVQMATIGSVALLEFKIESNKVAVKLASRANIEQTLPCCYARTLDGRFRSASVDTKVTITLTGCEITFPPLLDPEATAKSLSTQEHTMWMGTVAGIPPSSSQPSQNEGIEIVSIYHMGQILCSSSA